MEAKISQLINNPENILESDSFPQIQKSQIEKAAAIKKFIVVGSGLIGVAAWIGMFALGLMVNSLPYRTALLLNFRFDTFFASIMTYTPTNVAILCLLASLVGGCTSLLIAEKTGKHLNLKDHEKTDSYYYMTENPLCSMLRGLAVYFTFLAGVFVASNAPFATTTPEQFARAAGAISLLSFTVGYDPTIFRNIINLGGKLKKE